MNFKIFMSLQEFLFFVPSTRYRLA